MQMSLERPVITIFPFPTNPTEHFFPIRVIGLRYSVVYIKAVV